VLGIPGFYAMAIFLLILTVGFIYEWQKGALDWSKTIVIAKKATKKNNFLIKSKQLSVSPGVECGLITNLQQEIPVSLELVDKAYNNSFAEIILLSGTLLLLIFSAVKFFDKNVLEKQKLITIWLVFFMALTTYFYPGASDLSWYSIIFLAENFGFIS
jgi:hypothetical protein